MAGGGAGPARRRLRRHDPLLPKAPPAPAARAAGPGRLVRPRAPRPARPHPRAARPRPHARAHRPHPRRRARRHRRAARGRGRPGRRRDPRGVPHPRRARRAFRRARSRSSKPSPARTCSSRACTTAKRATPPPTSRSCNRDCGLLEQGLPLPDLLALAHEHHETTREIAETAVGLFDRYVRAPLRASDLPDDEKAEQLVEAFRMLLPAVTTLVAHHFRRVLLEVAQEHLESVGEDDRARGRQRRRREPARELADVSRTAHAPASPISPSSTTSRASVEAMFDRIAPRYDALNRLLTFRMDVALAPDRGARRSRSRARRACSTSRAAPATSAAPSPTPATRPVGVDFSAGMLRAAHTDAPLVRADALRLPFADATFDGITCGFALRNFAALAPVLAECARVLRPGGRIALLDVAEPASPARPVGARRVVPPRRAVRRRARLRPRRVPLPARVDRVPPAAARAARARRRRRHRRRAAGARSASAPPSSSPGPAPMTTSDVSLRSGTRLVGAQLRDRRPGRPARLLRAGRIRVARRRRTASSTSGVAAVVAPADAAAFLAADQPRRPTTRVSRRRRARGPSARCRSPAPATLVVPARIVGRDARRPRVAHGDRRRRARRRPSPIHDAAPVGVRASSSTTTRDAVARDGRARARRHRPRHAREGRARPRGQHRRRPPVRRPRRARATSAARNPVASCTPTAASSARAPSCSCARRARTVTARPLAGTGVDTDALVRSAKDAHEHQLVVDAVVRALARAAAPTCRPTVRRRSSSPTSAISPPPSPAAPTIADHVGRRSRRRAASHARRRRHAPRPVALDTIAALEPSPRGRYAGSVRLDRPQRRRRVRRRAPRRRDRRHARA